MFAVATIVLLSHILLVQGVLATDPADGVFTPDYQELEEYANDYANAGVYDSYLDATSPGFPMFVDNEFPKTSYADWDQGSWATAGSGRVLP